MTNLLQDLRFGARLALRHKATSLTAVLAGCLQFVPSAVSIRCNE